jgi:hypothetical protein
MNYQDYTEGGRLPQPNALAGDGAMASEIQTFRLPDDPSFVPVRMEVHEARDVRGHMPARICLLSSNRASYRSFVLPEGTEAKENRSGDGGQN